MNQDSFKNVKENSIVNHKSFGKCVVKSIKSDLIVVYCQSKDREINFIYPDAFYKGYLSATDDVYENKIEQNILRNEYNGFNELKTEATITKQKKLSTADLVKHVEYEYLPPNLIGKTVIKKDKSKGIIVEYINKGKNREGLLVIKTEEKIDRFLYPSSFIKGFLSFENDRDNDSILADIDKYKKNDKETIERETKQIKNKIGLINNLTKHLNCIKKCENVKDFCVLYKSAVNQEIHYMKTQGKKRYRLTNGKEVAQIGNKYVYSYESEIELSLIPDWAIYIYITQYNIINGIVISCEDNSIMFTSDKIDKKHLSEILISFDAWFIMEKLNNRLDELSDNHNDIVKQLVCGKTKVTKDTDLRFGQNNAIEMTCTNPITYIWGPPGTGKTYTLANIVKRLLNEGKRVLMLSYSNVSVDGAILEVAEHCTNQAVGNIIRYGYPKDKRLLNSDNLLTSYNVALSHNDVLKQKQKELLKEKESIDKSTKQYKDIQEELKKIRTKIKIDEDNVVNNALFIATTLSKAICDKQIFNQKFDAVLIDEVSMAYTPQIIYAANLATQHFCCIGDFNQLPPIVQNENDNNVLKYDIFEYCGDINNMVILDIQRRMHDNIARFISANMYFGLLKSHESTKDREQITNCEPFNKHPITYVDIHDINSKTKIIGTSHCNLLSALITARITEKAIDNNDFTVGIITPYNEQAKLINTILQVLLSVDDRKRVVCATVHQFQGSQRDIIIYDATDTSGEITHPGTLLESNKHNISNRLFNVAMTRAKGKFIVVADREFIDAGLTKGKTEKTKNSKSLFYSLSQHSKHTNVIINAKDLDFIINYEPSKPFVSFKANKEALHLYHSDLRCAKHSVRFDIASRITSYEFQNTYLKAIDNLEKNGINTNVYIDSYLNTLESYSTYAEKRKYIFTNLTIIDNEIVWIGDPLKIGSLSWRIKSKSVATKICNIQKI